MFKVGDKVKYIGPPETIYGLTYFSNKIYEAKAISNRIYGVYIPCEENINNKRGYESAGLWTDPDLAQYFILAKVMPLERLPKWW